MCTCCALYTDTTLCHASLPRFLNTFWLFKPFQLDEDLIFIDDELPMEKENGEYKRSLKKAEYYRPNKSGVHAFQIFTNLPNGTASGVAGHANVGSVCREKSVGILRGPDRGVLETAGVMMTK